ncbi:hypothetical protein H4R20_000557 [Coemansia guatemalensis]|uniref:DUF726-domain-containing protein n=1 Tax=Coemansia guatemalensis TaxID=2761395 RepID=A0A9W8LWS8_9FUNG|nr:hypothetical protein H4R20_000557 [Coemansia guatemalensis]
MAARGDDFNANFGSRSSVHPLARPAGRNTSVASRVREYEGPFPQHPSRGRSETSMSVIVPDRPVPLSSTPAAMAYRHDRRRDYFTDTSTLDAAMGKTAPRDAGIRYNLREHSSLESADAVPATALGLSTGSAVHCVEVDAANSKGTCVSDSAARAGARVSTTPSFPLFRRTESSKRTTADQRSSHGHESHLPRFMRDRLRRSGSIGSESSRTSIASNESRTLSSDSAANSTAMQSILELEEARLLDAERKSQLRAIDSILSEDQKIAYVGLVYVILVDIQDRLNVQHKESQSSTASFMNFSRRFMRSMYSHMHLSVAEQRMVELLPRHKVAVADMSKSLAAQGDTILVEADQDVAIVENQTDESLISALRSSSECRSSTESTEEGSALGWFRGKSRRAREADDVYKQYSVLPSEGPRPSTESDPKTDPDLDLDHKLERRVSIEHAEMRPRASSVASLEVDLRQQQSSTVSSIGISIHDGPHTAPLPSIASIEADPAHPLMQSEAATTAKDGSIMPTKVEAEHTLTIDVRATLVLDLFLLLLSDDVYDSRGRYLLRRLAEALRYPWIEVLRCERRVTRQLQLHDYSSNVTLATKNATPHAIKQRAHQGKTRRMVVIGLATVGGGLVIGLSAGLLAPAIGAGIGATLGAIGIANTGAFFGSIGGTALITGAATLTGSGLAGSQIARRTRFAEQFEFIPCINEGQTNLILTIPGWLEKADNGVFSFSTLDSLNGDHCSLLWESEALRRLGSSLRMIVGEVFSITLTQTLQHTVLPSLLGPLSIPMWLAKLGYVLDNPWSNGCELAFNAGPVMADLLLQRVQGQRPVTLVGYSIGARLIFYTLLELANMNAYGLVEDVYLFGAPVVASEKEWRTAAGVVGGRFVNAYSTKDWILGFFYRTTNLGRNSVAGLHPISGVNGLENVDVSDEVPGHNAYREVLPLLLHRLGVVVTSVELHDPNEIKGDSEEDHAIISELEKAAEMLEEHEKKKKNIWPWRWSFWERSQSIEDNTSKTQQSSPSLSPFDAHGEVNAAAHELSELGIDFKEVPSTLPTLVIEQNNRSASDCTPGQKP